MPSSLRSTDFLVEHNTDNDKLFYPVIDGERKGMGYIPRDLKEYPWEMYEPPAMKIIPQSEWSDRIKEKVEEKSQLSDIRLAALNGQPIPSLDQNGQGYCWFYSPTSATLVARAVANLPYVRLSAHAGACKIKNFRDEGGWCGLSGKFYESTGCPSVEFWPEKSTSREYDKPETWANAKLHRMTESWMDLARPVHDQQLTFEQLASLLLSNIPCAVDFNWWGHSVCALDLVEVEAGSFGIRIWNSWGDAWGDKGMSVLRGGKERPNGAIGIRATAVSVN